MAVFLWYNKDMLQKDICKKTLNYLKQIYPNPTCELNHGSAFELLVAVILSAQCTDKRVNQVTEVLFKKFNTPQDFANVDIKELETLIYPCGFYHNKAKNIINCSKSILTDFDGEVPNNLQDLQKLAGVGRKTANVVYSLWFGGDAIAVDTHVFRVSNRLEIAKGNTPEKVEVELMNNFDKAEWSKLHYRLVLFGRYICKAKKPKCENCGLKDVCKYYKNIIN